MIVASRKRVVEACGRAGCKRQRRSSAECTALADRRALSADSQGFRGELSRGASKVRSTRKQPGRPKGSNMFHPLKKVVVGVAAMAALALGGSAIAGAATSSTASTTTATVTTTHAHPEFNGPKHGTAAHENAEKAVTGSAAAKAQAAAVKSVGSGTAGVVTADFTGNGFETTVTKADGSKVAVHLDSAYTVVDGPGGHGDPAAG